MLDNLYKACNFEITNYMKYNDVLAEEDLMDVISEELIGISWPIYNDYTTKFDDLIARYLL
ncbi:Hypothetical protein HVR_LOCUS929 [uncultured virus]|nr:Hypothetical protein HVR_LOCUS929 [uncultured virus]